MNYNAGYFVGYLEHKLNGDWKDADADFIRMQLKSICENHRKRAETEGNELLDALKELEAFSSENHPNGFKYNGVKHDEVLMKAQKAIQRAEA